MLHLLIADILNTALAAFFVFSGSSYMRVMRSFRGSGGRASGSGDSRSDHVGSGLDHYIVPAFAIVVRLFSGARSNAEFRT